MDETNRKFYEALIKFFAETTKTGWGKVELVAKIKDIYIDVLTGNPVRKEE